MTNEEERLTVRMIERKLEEGGYAALTEREKTIIAYSPYGTFAGYGGGCLSAALGKAAKPIDGGSYRWPVSMN